MRKLLSLLVLYAIVLTNTAAPAIAAASAAAPPKRPITPILECVANLGGGNYSARFGYNNQNSGVETIAIGANNGFNPAPIDRGQPTSFLAGLRSNVFSVPFNGSSLTWTVKGPDGVARSVTASSSSTSCGSPTPTPTPTVTPTPTATPTPTPTPTPGSCVPGTFGFGGGQQQTSGSPNVRTSSVNGITLSTKAFARPRAGIAPATNFTPSFVSNQKPGYGVTNPGEGSGGGDLSKIDNSDDQSPAQIDYIVQFSSTPVVFDRAVLERVGADSDVRIWIGNAAALPASINQAFLDTLYTEYLPDGGGPTRTINFNAGNLAGNLLVIAPSPAGVNDSFLLKSVTYTCPPTGPVNTPPDAVNDNATVAEDSGANIINVLANDTDADGNALTITAVTQPTGSAGTVVNNGTNVTFTPATNFAGNTSFTYTISDGQGGSDTATVNVTVTPVNDAPVAIGNSYTTNEDTVLNVSAPGVLGNDMDVDGPGLSAVLVSTTSNGTLVLNSNGSFSYTPNPNFSGTDTFVYQATDGIALSGPATVTINVTPVNDPPDAVNDSATVEEDSTNNAINVLANDSDGDGGTLSLTAATNGANGTVTFTATGVSYTPNANYNGSDSFTYTINDGQGGSDTATVNVTVTALNDAPDAVNDSASVQENSTDNAINVLANDTDIDGDSLTVSAVTQGANGVVTFTATGVNYTPNANFTGTDTFTYTISDGNGGSDTATVTVNVTNVNQAPHAVDDSATVAEDSGANAINVLANDTDPDGDTLSVTAVTQGANGSVSFTATGVSYTPNANFNGSDSFTYTISDGNGGSDTATVSVTVTAVNESPVAVNDSASVVEDSSNNVINVLANDNDGGDGGPLSVTAVTQGANGSVTFTATGVSYTPNANFNGSDSFIYTISDGTDSDTATVTVTVIDVPEAGQFLVNEVEFEGPGAIPNNCQYVEIIGQTPGSVIPANTWFITIDNSNANPGNIAYAANIGGAVVGANGTITLLNSANAACPNRVYGAGTTIFTSSQPLALGFFSSRAFLLVTSSRPFNPGLNIDQNQDGQFDFSVSVIDGFAFTINPEEEFNYGGAPQINIPIIPPGGTTDVPDAATRFLGDTGVLNAGSWYYGELAGAPEETTEYANPRSPNFPAGGRLTPGDQNTLFTPNQPPDAVDDAATVAEDSTNNVIDVLANDTDSDGGTLTITAATNGANGTVVNNGTNLSYTPNANFTGTDTFTYTISDGQGGNDTATVTVTVGAVNDAPDAVNDSASVAENSTNNVVNVLANDTDGDGDTLTITAATNGANGTVVNNGTNVSYTPNLNFEGIDTFTYTISDGNGGSDTATVTITVVGGANQAPNAVDDAGTVAEDSGANAINVLANDSDPDGDSLSVTAATNGANGSVTFTATGVSYTPNANFNGSDSFTYTISDGTLSDTATVTVTVTAVNDAPDAVNDSASVTEDSTNNIINVLANDTDVDSGQTLTIAAATNGANGTVVNNGTNVAYTPNANFTGSDSFTYTISDGNGGSDTATVNVTVGGANDAPDAVNDSATVAEDSGANAINVLANDTDPDGDSLSVTAATQGANGSVTFTATGVSYTPNANFSGSDSFTYTISDGNGGTDTATVAVTVTGVNDDPDAVNDSASVAEDSTSNAINVLANDTDIDGNPLTITAATQGANGSVTFTATGVSYTPNANFVGSDSFTYTISDGQGGTDTATVNVTVGGTNDAPDAVNDSATVGEDSGANPLNVLANDTDPDGDSLSVTAVTQGANGSVTFTATGVSYTPNANFSGSDSFTYTISDGNGGTDTATVAVAVTGVNDAPDAVNDSATVAEDSGANAINVLANDTDPEGNTLSVTAVTQGANGSVTFTATGVSYTPNANFSGSDSFTYTISDGNGGSDTATVNITVTGVNDAPDAVNDSATVAEDSSANAINVLANDTDPEGNTLSVTAVTQGANGSVTFTATGVSYTPNANFSGSDSFTYSISDGNGGTDTATVAVTVTAANDAPDAVNDSATVAEDSGANVINVLANDTDPEGNTLSVTAVTQGADGSVTFTATGVSYTPNANFNGSDSFTYTISDGNGGSDTATVNVTVTAVNDAPDAVNDSATVAEDTTNNVINVLANDTDIDAGQTLAVSAVTQGTNGSVVNNGTNVSYTPAPDFFGTDTFTYTISDGNGGTDTATVTVTVTDVPDNPPAGQLLVNEVEIDPPSTASDGCQYVEIRAANAGGQVPANTWFITIDNSAANPGNIAFASNIGGTIVGPNGTITILNSGVGTCAGRTFDAGTTIVTINNPLGLGFVTSSRAYLLVTSATPFIPGQNIDQDQDGQFDNPATVIDGFAFNINPEEEFNYGGSPQINIPGSTELPDAVTRFLGNTTPLDGNAFYWGELAASPDNTTTYAAPFSSNFPAGGQLTPGGVNVP